MKGYIYTMYQGADPGRGWAMNDPIFGSKPTLGACVPNIRRKVEIGDWIFVVSGRAKAERQYIVGGFKVEEKIDQMTAYHRFPDLRVHRDDHGHVHGNVIVDASGGQSAADSHSNFERRLENYIVGCEPIQLESPKQVEQARVHTLSALNQIFQKEGNRPFDIIGRFRRMESEQVGQMRAWLESIKAQHP